MIFNMQLRGLIVTDLPFGFISALKHLCNRHAGHQLRRALSTWQLPRPAENELNTLLKRIIVKIDKAIPKSILFFATYDIAQLS